MCCSWTTTTGGSGNSSNSSSSSGGGSATCNKWPERDMSHVSNVVLAEHMKQKIRRDLSRWSRKLLLCLGLENIGKHIVGDSKWEKLYDGCPSSSSTTAEQDQEDASADFEPQMRDETPPPKGKSPTSLDTGTATVQSVQVDVGEGEEEGEDETGTAETDPACRVENGKVDEGLRIEKEGSEDEPEEGNAINDEEEREGGRRVRVKSHDEVGEEDEGEEEKVGVTATSSPHHISQASKMEEEERGVMEEEECEDEVEEPRGEGSGNPSPMSGSPPMPSGGESGLLDRGPDSPNSGSEAAQSAEEKGGTGGSGGALVDNLFQILPYWYFLNRAFGMPGGPEGGLGTPLGSSVMDGQGEGEDEDDDGGGSSIVDGGVGPDSGRGSASSPFGGVGGQQSSAAATHRLNSLLLLESLRQQLQSQGQQGLISNEQTLQQQLQISELLTKMSGGSGGTDGRNVPSWQALQRAHNSLLGDSQQVNNNNNNNNVTSRPASVEQAEMDDQPLDLTSCRTNKEEEKVGLRDYPDLSTGNPALNHLRNNTASPFILDEQTSKVFRSNPRSSKGYTAQELQAALHDIQSGKLGTRRAAVIYGIPRSTLRNKVYKLGKDRGRLFNSTGTVVNQNHALNNNNNICNNNNNTSKDAAGNPSLLGKLSYFHGLSATSSYLGSGSVRGGGAPPSVRYNNMEEDERDDATPPPSFLNRRAPPSLYAMGNGDASPPKQLVNSSHLHHPHQSSLSQLISKHAHQQRTFNHQAYQGSPMDVAMMEESSCHSDEQGPVGTQLLNQQHKDSWKYALTRHQEQQHQLLSQQQRQAVNTMNHYQRQPPHQQQSQQNHGAGSGGDDASSSLDLGKKSRPKRGKYRNYDREALVKAVRAVQNGEMSVHRAGSFFGVPHSTLEYKVKERHLLRRPKRKEVTSPLSQTKSSSPESSSQDAVPPNSTRHTNAFSKVSASAKGLINNNNNNNNSSGESGGLHHPYLFPLTTDLRESLTRYLSQESNKGDDDRASSSEIMDTGTSGQHDQDEDDDDDPPPPPSLGNHRLHHQLTQNTSSSGKSSGGGAAALALEGLIGNRLSNLFQLNDILLRSGGSGGTGDTRPENLLDLSKK